MEKTLEIHLLELREQIAKDIEQACESYCIEDYDIDGVDICFYHRDSARIARAEEFK